MKNSQAKNIKLGQKTAVKALQSVVNTVNRTSREGFELTDDIIYEKMRDIPMWCGDDKKHKKNKNYHHDFCCSTHVAGLPQHPATMEEMPPTKFQLHFIKKIFKAVRKPTKIAIKMWKRLSHKFHIAKGRQMGFTEWVLRIIFHFCFSRYAGRNVAIIAATNGALAKKNLRRFMRLFSHIRNVIPKGIFQNTCQLTNDTTVGAYPATDEPITGDTKYAAIFMDESAKWIKVDDTPVFNGIMPIVRSNGSDLFLVSTFKGAKKMFYEIWKTRPKDFLFMKYTIKATIGNLYTKQQVDEMMAVSVEDAKQEYMAEPSQGKDSMYGVVTDSQKEDIKGWGVYNDPPVEKVDDEYKEDEYKEEDEDDGYVEKDDGLLSPADTTEDGKESYTWGDSGDSKNDEDIKKDTTPDEDHTWGRGY